MSFDPEGGRHSVIVGTVVEQNRDEAVRCEERHGEAFFVFWSGDGSRRVVVHADTYLASLTELRQHPINYEAELREILHG